MYRVELEEHTDPSRTTAHTYTRTSAPPSTPSHTYHSSHSSPSSAPPNPPVVRNSTPHSARSLPARSCSPPYTVARGRLGSVGILGGGRSRDRRGSWGRRWVRSRRLGISGSWLGRAMRRCRSSRVPCR